MKKTKKTKKQVVEPDSLYFLKIVLFFIIGCLWLRMGGETGISVPIGLIFGIILTSHEHFQIDRKIEYAVLLLATIISYIAPIGFVLNIS